MNLDKYEALARETKASTVRLMLKDSVSDHLAEAILVLTARVREFETELNALDVMLDDEKIVTKKLRARVREWQPIETGPKDGTHILFWCGLFDPGDVQLGIWFDGIWLGDGYCGRWETLDGTTLEGPYHPTHWMPMPDPPTVSHSHDEVER